MSAISAPGFIRTRDGVDLFYRDWGQGKPVLFVAGWSLPSDMWQYQMLALSQRGLRCIAFDRRGHGRSSDPGRGYDFDTLADVIEALDLREVALVGHSMGCNEIVRYISRHGDARVQRIALLGTMTPMICRDDSNPGGLDPALLEYFRTQQLGRDFPQWIDENLPPFVAPETPSGMRNWLRQLALGASLQALVECNRSLAGADFRAELPRIARPVLVIAGDRDVSAPFELTAKPTMALLPDAQLRLYEDTPHGMFVTRVDRVNDDLLTFLDAA